MKKIMKTKSLKSSMLRIVIIGALNHAQFQALHSHYEIFYSEHPEDGLLQARLHKPDLIINSCQQENNFRIQLKKHSRTRGIPVLATIPREDVCVQKIFFFSGCDDFIRSPFEEQELLVRVQVLLRNRVYLQKKYIDFRPEADFESSPEHFLKCIKNIVEQNLNKSLFGVSELAVEAGVSQPQLYRKLIALTGFSPNGYIRHIRLKHAALLLSARAGNVSEIACRVGFSSQSYFARCFKAVHHQNPKRWSGVL
ncbi:MAG: helix-turn-helix domain-containing protein [Cyclobacteriaceae bacterium]